MLVCLFCLCKAYEPANRLLIKLMHEEIGNPITSVDVRKIRHYKYIRNNIRGSMPSRRYQEQLTTMITCVEVTETQEMMRKLVYYDNDYVRYREEILLAEELDLEKKQSKDYLRVPEI